MIIHELHKTIRNQNEAINRSHHNLSITQVNGDNVTQTIFIWETRIVAKLTTYRKREMLQSLQHHTTKTDTQSFFEVKKVKTRK